MAQSVKIGRYTDLKEIGQGGMAVVYRAHDPQNNRPVAIKMIRPDKISDDSTFMIRFRREAKALMSLEHPAIVPVYTSGEAAGRPYLVMRLMAGGTLTDKLANGPLPLDEAAKILGQLAPALDYAHRKNIVHRDLKPDNILFDDSGNPYISDFGIAKLLTDNETNLTHTEMTMGTLAYLSPEQARGETNLDGRSDIYTLGAILFEMLAGKRPYQASNSLRIIYLHSEGAVPDICEANPALPPACQTIIEWAMAKDRERRCPTAGDLAQAVTQLAAHSPVPLASNNLKAADTVLSQEPGKRYQYDDSDELGRGGMAAVYRAYDTIMKRDVALKKMLPNDSLEQSGFRARFKREIAAIKQLTHPAVVAVYDDGEEEGQPFLAMQLMMGGTLADKLARGPLSLSETAEILQRLAPALDYAHARGIVHRDLKPANILFDEAGNPYLSDFGIVKLTDEEATRLTRTGWRIGTAAYMSPEQASGETDLDGRSDVYALGIILFEMLTGVRPYRATTPLRVIEAHTNNRITPIKQANPTLPASCQAVIDWALAKDKEERCPTASDLAIAVNKLAAEQRPAHPAPPAHPVSPPARSATPPWVWVGAFALAALVLVSLVTVVGGWAFLSGRAASPTLTPEMTAVIAAESTSSLTPKASATAAPSPTLSPTATAEPATAVPLIPPTETAASAPTVAPSSPVPSPTIAPTNTPEPQLRVAIASANLRDGPGVNYPAIGVLSGGVLARAIGRDADASWYNVELSDGRTGWLAASAVAAVNEGALTAVPLAATIPPPPTFTPTPTATPTPTNTNTPSPTPAPPSTPTPAEP